MAYDLAFAHGNIMVLSSTAALEHRSPSKGDAGRRSVCAASVRVTIKIITHLGFSKSVQDGGRGKANQGKEGLTGEEEEGEDVNEGM